MRLMYALLTMLLASLPAFAQNDSTGTVDSSQISHNTRQLRDARLGSVHLYALAGYSYRVASTPSNMPQELQNYVKGLKSGWLYEVGLSVFLGEKYGFLARFRQSFSSNSAQNINVPGIGTTSTEDNITVTYIGPAFVERMYVGKSSLILGHIGLGYLGYKNNSRIGDNPLDISGSALGFDVGLGYEFQIAEGLDMGIHADYLIGSISKVTVNGQSMTISPAESLNSLGFALKFQGLF